MDPEPRIHAFDVVHVLPGLPDVRKRFDFRSSLGEQSGSEHGGSFDRAHR